MKPLLILLTLFLTACEITTTVEQINKAIALCDVNGGLNHIGSPTNNSYKFIYCNNKAEFEIGPKD